MFSVDEGRRRLIEIISVIYSKVSAQSRAFIGNRLDIFIFLRVLGSLRIVNGLVAYLAVVVHTHRGGLLVHGLAVRTSRRTRA